jgi:hypothetical protein
VPVEVVREPVGKKIFKKFWNKSKRFGFVPNYKMKWKSSAFVLKILEQIKTFWFCSKIC